VKFAIGKFPICRHIVCQEHKDSQQGVGVRNCLTDEGRPLGTGLEEQVPNHLRRLLSMRRTEWKTNNVSATLLMPPHKRRRLYDRRPVAGMSANRTCENSEATCPAQRRLHAN
jgi:hypothetical protein